MTKEALKLALEALETLDCGDTYKTHNAASALRKALAQPEQEPVAWRVSYQNDPELGFWFAEGIGGEGCLNEPLYTTPPQRKPLTDEEISSLWDGHTVPVFGEIGINPIVFARAIEAAHGIKGEA